MNNVLQVSEDCCKLFAIQMAKGLLSFCLPIVVTSLVLAAPSRFEEIHGDVQKRAVGGLDWMRVVPGDKIEEGSSIRTGVNSSASVVTERGHRFEIHSETTLEFTALQPDE